MRSSKLFPGFPSCLVALLLSVAAPLLGGELLSQGRPCVASSEESSLLGPANVVDGVLATRWSSAFADNQWLQVDLGESCELEQVSLEWETAYARDYAVLASEDGSSWSTLASVPGADGGRDELRVTGRGRYVRLACGVRATPWGFSVYEFQITGRTLAKLEAAKGLELGNLSLGAEASETPFFLRFEGAWTCSSTQPWLTLSPASGSGPGVAVVAVARNTSGAGRSGSLRFKNGTLTKAVTVYQSAGQALTALPSEVLGTPGVIERRSLNLKAAPANVSYLWLRTHRLSWREDGEFAGIEFPRGSVRPGSKGSVRLNGGPWVPLTNATVTSEGEAGELGGLNGSYATVAVRLPIAALGSPGLKSGGNTLELRLDATDGLSLGWRVLGVDLRNAGGISVTSNRELWDDPNTWTPPLNTPADIAAGKQLWTSAALTDLGFSNTRHPIRAKCASCHERDGRDLAYFNYSNKSISRRAIFHGLSSRQANQVASYIRSLDLGLPQGYTRRDAGRPWNPPYQPGPGLDARPVELWAAGAGLEAVLSSDVQMRHHLFPNGEYKPELLGASGFLNPRETPQSLQYPDWNAWLPVIGPEDLVEDPATLPDSEPIKAFKQAEDWLKAYRWTNMEQDDWYLNVGLFYVGQFNGARYKPFIGEHWYTSREVPDRTRELELKQTRHNLARVAWFNVRLFELIQKYRLDNITERGPSGGTPEVPAGYRSWGIPARTVFETAPHFVADHAGLSFNFTQPGNYLSTAWYSLEQIFNGGYRAGGFGIDWNYHPFHIMGMHHGGTGYYTNGPIHTYRAAWSLIWMYQTIPTMDWRKEPVGPWTPKSFGFSQRQLGLGLDSAYGADELVARGELSWADRVQLQEALALAFLGIAERYTPDQWVRRPVDDDAHRSSESFETMDYPAGFNPYNAYDLPERGFQADAYYLRIKVLKEQRLVSDATLRRLVTWARGVWPKGSWDLLLP